MRLHQLIGDRPDLPAIAAHLDGLDNESRIAETMSLGRSEQRALFRAAKGFREIHVTDFVPSRTGPMREIVHHGRNTLPAFRRFAKVFCQPDEPEGELWGYNRNGPFIMTTVGPGYFVAYDHGDGEVLIDYLRQPPAKPRAWPEIASITSRFSRFVYHGTQDLMRGVSKHVNIGRATRGGKEMAAWFVLCREDHGES
ncbi:MAG: hypothetical protein AAGF12_24470 [Myxococcota bacterium]